MGETILQKMKIYQYIFGKKHEKLANWKKLTPKVFLDHTWVFCIFKIDIISFKVVLEVIYVFLVYRFSVERSFVFDFVLRADPYVPQMDKNMWSCEKREMNFHHTRRMTQYLMMNPQILCLPHGREYNNV